jgi:hypothetical protein
MSKEIILSGGKVALIAVGSLAVGSLSVLGIQKLIRVVKNSREKSQEQIAQDESKTISVQEKEQQDNGEDESFQNCNSFQADDKQENVVNSDDNLFLEKILPNGGAHLILTNTTALGQSVALTCIANDKIKRALWLAPTIDSCNKDKLKAMNKKAGGKIYFVFADGWNERLKAVLKTVEAQAAINAVARKTLTIGEAVGEKILETTCPKLSKFLDLRVSDVLAVREKTIKQYKDVQDQKSINSLWLYELIVNTQFAGQFDAIVIDPLIAFADSSSQINPKTVQRLINTSIGKNRNIYILHESNGKYGIKGGNGIGKLCVSTVWTDLQDDGKYAFQAITAFKPAPIIFKADLISGAEGYDFKLRDDGVSADETNKKQSIKEQILALLQVCKCMSRKELYQKIKAEHESINNKIRELGRDEDPKRRIKVLEAEERVDDIIELAV